MNVASVMRWVCVGLVAYLVPLVVLQTSARLAGLRVLQRGIDRLTPRALRRLAAMVTGLMVGIPTVARAQTTTTVDAPVVMHRLPVSTSSSSVPPPTPVPTAPVAPPTPTRRVWNVQPGQHFWAIAAATLHDTWGRDTTAAEIAPYWRELIDANRARLRDPGNPNLVYPGQEFDLPPV